MSPEARLREAICRFARSLYDRGLTHGSTGNISARLEDGGLLVTPTGSSFGSLDPADLALLDAEGRHLSGSKPTKEMPLHAAFYRLRGAQAGAVVHLHSHHAVALSVLDDIDPDNVLPPLTPYPIMQLGRVRLVPYHRPGDPALGAALEALPAETSAVVLANHGPVVAGASLQQAV
ncbi:MAG: aldolase, partial [Alphaproteobacteria bacterium]